MRKIVSWNKALVHTKGRTWESDKDVIYDECEYIPDVYEEILKEERLGNIIVHRYAEIDPEEQKMHANYIRDHIDDENKYKEYREFLVQHVSSLWD